MVGGGFDNDGVCETRQIVPLSNFGDVMDWYWWVLIVLTCIFLKNRWYLFSRKKWKLVKTIDDGICLTTNSKEKKGTLFYHLFESDSGDRCTQIKTTLSEIDQTELEKYAVTTTVYHTKIYRWLLGRNDPEILRYTEVDEEETVHYLKGTISENVR